MALSLVKGGFILVLVVLIGVSWFGQFNVQRAQERISTLGAQIRSLRSEAQVLRDTVAAAEQRAITERAECKTRTREAFLTFVELDRGIPSTYIALAQVLLESIAAFSTRPVLVYGATANEESEPAKELRAVVSAFPRANLRFIRPSPNSLFFSKLKAVVVSGVDCGIYVDADAVVNYRVDDLFETCEKARRPYPLLVSHNNDPNNQAWPGPQPKSAPYAWAASFMWTAEALPFLVDVYERCVANEFTRSNFDETALNVLIWERQITEQACVFVTYPRAGELEMYFVNQSWPASARYTVHDLIAFHISSGGKNTAKSRALIELYKRAARQGHKVYYNQRTGKWLDKSEVGLCLVNPPLVESQAKAKMLFRWSLFKWEERRDCCKDDPAYQLANLP